MKFPLRSLRSPGRSLRAVAFAASVACLLGQSARAVTYTDAGGTSLFSTAFNPAIPAGGTTFADTFVFNNTGASTQTDDLTQTLNANVLTFSNTGTLTLNPGAGTTINLGGTAPQINLLNSGSLTMSLNLALSADVTFTGTSSVGNLVAGANDTSATTVGATFGGVISGTGFGLTKGGTYTFYNAAYAATSTSQVPIIGSSNATPGGGFFLSDYGGVLALTGNNTYTGATTASVGILQVSGAGGRLSGTSGVTVNGNATFIEGDTAPANNNLTNRINSAATLTLGGASGGGTFTSAFGTTAASQTFASLTVGAGGQSTINTSGTAAGTLGLTFTGTAGGAGYTRSTGGLLNVATATGFTTSFTNAPTAAGGSSVAGTSAPILIGATLGGNDFVAAAAGALAAPTYTASGATTLAADANINVTGANTTLANGSTVSVNSLRFPDTTARTLALGTGSTLTVASGGILLPSSIAESGATISGGTITSGTGDLWIYAGATGNSNPRSATTALTISSVIANNGATPVALTVGGGQQVTLSGINTYSGGTFLNGGLIAVAADSGLGAAAGTVTAVSGINAIATSANFTFNASRNFVINSNALLEIGDRGAITNTIAGTISGGGILEVGYVSSGQRLILTGNNSNFTGVYNALNFLQADEGVGLSSNANLTFAGRGSFTTGVLETTAATFTRPLGNGAGQVQWAQDAQFGAGGFSAVGASPLTVNIGGNATPAQLTYGVGGFLSSTLATTGNNLALVLQDGNATSTLTFQNPLALNGANRQFVVGSTSFGATLSGVLSGNTSSGITLGYPANSSTNPTGTLTLTGANTYQGSTTINVGALSVSSLNHIASGSINGGATTTSPLASSSLGAPTTAALGTINIGSGGVTASLIYTGAGETTDRAINLPGTTGGATLSQSGTGALVFTSNITSGTLGGSKPLTLTGSMAGTGMLSGSYGDSSGAIPATVGTSGALGATTITFTSNPGFAVGQVLSGTGIVAGTTITAVSGNTVTLSMGTNAAIPSTTSLTDTGTFANNVIKSGTGTWTLAGANTYNGTTTVSGGALILNNPSAGTGAVNVSSGGTLLGNGTAPSGLLTVAAGGNLAPGATANGTTSVTSASSAGKLTVGALTLTGTGAGSNFNVFLADNASATGAGAGTVYSQLATSGATTLAGNLNLTLSGTLAVNDKFFILDNTSASTTTGTFANVSGNTFTSGGYTFSINYADTFDATAGNDISLTVTAVPEPSTWVAGLACLAVLGFQMRRRVTQVFRRRA